MQKLRSLDLGALPVCEGQRLVGMVTDRAITIRAAAYGHDPNAAPVRNYMSSDLMCCFEDQDINVIDAYGFVVESAKEAIWCVEVEDMEQTARTIEEKGFKILSEGELYEL